jgi:hypothetical protein
MNEFDAPSRETADAGSAATPQDHPAHAQPALGPFSAARLRWQMISDRLLRAAVTVGVLGVLLIVTAPAGGGTGLSWLSVVLAVALVLGAWMMLNGISARTSVQLPRLTAMIESDPAEAEAELAWHLKRKPLMGWVRLLLYHRLALLRHAQERYDEAAAICHTVLTYRLGPAEPTRRHLLLLLAEAHLERSDVHGAYPPLAMLYHQSLSLMESMQRLALQTRYELLAGYADRALWQHVRKRHLAELMPAAHCAAMHAMLATAARQAQQHRLSDWLWRRVRLLASPKQAAQFEAGRFTVKLVGEMDQPGV